MIYQSPRKTRLSVLLKNKGFYAIAALCVVAAGTGILAARQTGNQPPLLPPSTDQQQYATIPWQSPTDPPSQNVNDNVNNVPDDRTEPTTKVTTKPDPNTPFTGEYSLPMGTDIVRDYSSGEIVYVPTLDDWRTHDGVDFSGALGNEVIAMQAGKVKSVTADELWGNVVEIEHGNGLLARYCGLQKEGLPKVGATVKRDARIGQIGEVPCEALDAPHLHLEIRVNGKIVDPLSAMNKLGESN
ncbi:MAG: M23 family metallopeptidase [Oscillospiraceae bacterium]|jgi:murein DD-endopeptidase MepM/ murein hydrolase activator NlpD|nr:M23 family metallopeptidase [Oscillospiraceae bacterium]